MNQKLIEADKLFLEDKYEEVVLQLKECQCMHNAQVSWRLAKAKYHIALELECHRKEEWLQLMTSAQKIITKALKIDPSLSEVHIWYAIILFEFASEFDGKSIDKPLIKNLCKSI